jgi:hypothetical protein
MALLEKFNQCQLPWYPLEHPAPPQNHWDFASLGEVLKASRRQPPLYWRLLELRNTLAHCHFVGWKQIQAAVDVMR